MPGYIQKILAFPDDVMLGRTDDGYCLGIDASLTSGLVDGERSAGPGRARGEQNQLNSEYFGAHNPNPVHGDRA